METSSIIGRLEGPAGQVCVVPRRRRQLFDPLLHPSKRIPSHQSEYSSTSTTYVLLPMIRHLDALSDYDAHAVCRLFPSPEGHPLHLLGGR